MEVETYNIRYEYTDPMTGCFNTISTDIQINESPYADFAFGPQPANIDDPEIDFVGLAQSFGLKAWRVTEPDDIAPALRQGLGDGSGPHLIDVVIDNGFSESRSTG